MIAKSQAPEAGSGLLLQRALLLSPSFGRRAMQDVEIAPDGRIAAVDDHRSPHIVPPGYRVLDLEGRAVIPGLIDTHFHLFATALADASVDLSGASTVAEIQDRLAAASTTIGGWVLGSGFEDNDLPPGETLDRGALDAVPGEAAIFVEHRSLHFAVLNSVGLARAGVETKVRTRGADDPWRTGIRTAHLLAARRDVVLTMGAQARLDGMRLVSARMASRGATTIGALEGGEAFGDADLDALARGLDDFPTWIVPYWISTDVATAARLGLPRIGGDVHLDGTIGSRTAAIREPYSDDPSTRGLLYRRQRDVDAFVRDCYRLGIQPAVHAIGGRAIERALVAMERGGNAIDRDECRPRIDHFGEPTREQIGRAARLGVVVASQPPFAFLRGAPGAIYEQRMGAARVAETYPFRRLVDEGVHLGGGSDSPVVPRDPILGLHSLVNGHHESQRLSVREALNAYTHDAAWVCREDEIKGDIRVGLLADLAVLDQDIFTIAPERIRDTEVLLTLKGGRITFDAGVGAAQSDVADRTDTDQ